MTSGTLANRNGHVFEQMLIPIFTSAGFEILSRKEKPTTSRYIVRGEPFTTIYGNEGKTEFLIVAEGRRIRVEVKYQSVSGSVDEKYPYMLLNGIYQYPEKEIIFIVDGGGYRASAREWLQTMIDQNWLDYKSVGKCIMLMRITEFVNWFHHEFSNY